MSLTQPRAIRRRLGRDLAPNTIHNIRSELNAKFRPAVRRRLIDMNPLVEFEDVKPIRAVQAVDVVIDRAQAHRILRAVTGSSIEHVMGLLMYTGCRLGEALALRWNRVDLNAGTIRLAYTLTRNLDGSYSHGDSKTERSKRRSTSTPRRSG